MIRAVVCVVALLIAAPQTQLPEATQKAIGDIVQRALDASGTPSASIAIVVDGKVAFTRAHGKAKVDPDVAATAAMRYKIASNSKQFAASAMLLLQEEGKLSIDDRVAKFLPDLSRAKDITVRQLLSHTSGYRDYYPLDYVAPFMAKDTTADEILTKWAKTDLDFEPGSRWQYSNTNYVVAGRIIEKVSGQPLMAFLRARILDKLGMTTAVDVTSASWSAADPIGKVDSALIDSDLSAYFTPQAVADFSASLKAAGAVTSFTEASREDRGGMVHRTFSVQTATRRLSINAYVDKDGRFSQFLITPAS